MKKATTIKKNGYEFLGKPIKSIEFLGIVGERESKMAQIQKAIADNKKGKTSGLHESSLKAIELLGKRLHAEFNSIPVELHEFIIDSWISQNGGLKRKNKRLFRLIQSLMVFINEVDGDKYRQNEDRNSPAIKDS